MRVVTVRVCEYCDSVCVCVCVCVCMCGTHRYTNTVILRGSRASIVNGKRPPPFSTPATACNSAFSDPIYGATSAAVICATVGESVCEREREKARESEKEKESKVKRGDEREGEREEKEERNTYIHIYIYIYIRSRLHAETGCRKVYAGEVSE